MFCTCPLSVVFVGRSASLDEGEERPVYEKIFTAPRVYTGAPSERLPCVLREACLAALQCGGAWFPWIEVHCCCVVSYVYLS